MKRGFQGLRRLEEEGRDQIYGRNEAGFLRTEKVRIVRLGM